MCVCIYIYIYTCIHIYVYTHTYIERERGSDLKIYIIILLYVLPLSGGSVFEEAESAHSRPASTGRRHSGHKQEEPSGTVASSHPSASRLCRSAYGRTRPFPRRRKRRRGRRGGGRATGVVMIIMIIMMIMMISQVCHTHKERLWSSTCARALCVQRSGDEHLKDNMRECSVLVYNYILQ